MRMWVKIRSMDNNFIINFKSNTKQASRILLQHIITFIRSSSRGLLSFKKSKSRFLFRFEPFHDCNQDPRQILFLASSWIYSLVFPGSLIWATFLIKTDPSPSKIAPWTSPVWSFSFHAQIKNYFYSKAPKMLFY